MKLDQIANIQVQSAFEASAKTMVTEVSLAPSLGKLRKFYYSTSIDFNENISAVISTLATNKVHNTWFPRSVLKKFFRECIYIHVHSCLCRFGSSVMSLSAGHKEILQLLFFGISPCPEDSLMDFIKLGMEFEMRHSSGQQCPSPSSNKLFGIQNNFFKGRSTTNTFQQLAQTRKTGLLLSAPLFKKGVEFFIVAQPAGSEAVLRCPAEGNPKPNITWIKDGKPIKRPTFQHKWSLTIDGLVPEDKGSFTCILTNELGSINGTYTVDVIERYPYPPMFQDGYPLNVTVHVGESATFECRVFSDLTPFFKWYKHYKVNGSSVNKDGIHYSTPNTGADSPSENSPILHFANTTMENSGQYTCIAANSIGFSRGTAWLTVIPRLVDATITSISEVQSRSFWSFILNQPIYVYVIVGLSTLMSLVILTLSVIMVCRYWMQSKKAINNPSPIRKRVILERQDPGDILGEGAFGQVKKANVELGENGDKTIVAEMADLISEMEIMKLMGKHEHIISLVGCCTQNGPLYVVTEYASRGNLLDYLRNRRPKLQTDVEGEQPLPLMLGQLVLFAYQVAQGMEYLSSKRVRKRKIWSFGIVLWEIITLGGTPYPAIRITKLFNLLKNGYRMDRPYQCPIEMYMQDCWKSVAKERPTFSVLVERIRQISIGEENLDLQKGTWGTKPLDSNPDLEMDSNEDLENPTMDSNADLENPTMYSNADLENPTLDSIPASVIVLGTTFKTQFKSPFAIFHVITYTSWWIQPVFLSNIFAIVHYANTVSKEQISNFICNLFTRFNKLPL
uniref:receptor protein-tyrosine kinase n=1 Tax=Strigamia maritima TaxID=126957 RepID=T1IQE1_STRMM